MFIKLVLEWKKNGYKSLKRRMVFVIICLFFPRHSKLASPKKVIASCGSLDTDLSALNKQRMTCKSIIKMRIITKTIFGFVLLEDICFGNDDTRYKNMWFQREQETLQKVLKDVALKFDILRVIMFPIIFFIVQFMN